MRYVIYGAGAVGGVVGGRLFQHGRDVVLIARGAHLAAIRAGGLILESPNERLTLHIPAVERPSELDPRPGDVVLMAMKTQDTAPALDELAAVYSDNVAVACLQNGVENERLALRRFTNVYGIPVMLPATHLEPGVVQANSANLSGVLDVGRYPSGVDATAIAVSADLADSEFSSVPDPMVMRKKYTKLLMNLGNATQAACGEVDASAVLSRARDEAIACYRAAGIDFASDEEDRARRADPTSGSRRSLASAAVAAPPGRASPAARPRWKLTTSTAKSACSGGFTASRRP